VATLPSGHEARVGNLIRLIPAEGLVPDKNSPMATCAYVPVWVVRSGLSSSAEEKNNVFHPVSA
jgi:hypothetical protein